MNKQRQPLYEQVAERLIEQLEKGTSPFQKPWQDVKNFEMPFNPTTGKDYRGMNSIWLMMQGFEDPRWLTFKQAKANDWSIEKGSHGSLINYVKLFEDRIKRDGSGNPLKDEQGNNQKIRIKLDRPIITSAIVFNASQVRGIPQLERETEDRDWADLKLVEKLVKNSEVRLRHGGNQAYYNPAADSITMPPKKQFAEASGYYGVLLHEMSHWTGHESRLDRSLLGKSGTYDYAKEELRAEISSLMLGSRLKVGRDFDQHAAYVKSWISILKDEPFELYRASADAQKITDYLLRFQNTRARDLSPSEVSIGTSPDAKRSDRLPAVIQENLNQEVQTSLKR